MEQVMLETVELPTVQIHDPETGDWGVTLPASLLPGDVQEIGACSQGLYIELRDGRYDFIEWDEVAELVRGNVEAHNVGAPIPYRLTPAGFLAVMGDRVRAEAGPAPTVLTGRERAFAAWVAAPVEYVAVPERLLVANGRA